MCRVLKLRLCSLRLSCWLLLLACGGCGSGPLKLDSEIARDALETTLKAWQSGDSASDLAKRSPAIIVSDIDWKAGKKLVEFNVRKEESAAGSSLRKSVELVLKAESASPTRVEAVYVISTRPVITVFRQENE
mgnify:CR=1 FL=1